MGGQRAHPRNNLQHAKSDLDPPFIILVLQQLTWENHNLSRTPKEKRKGKTHGQLGYSTVFLL